MTWYHLTIASSEIVKTLSWVNYLLLQSYFLLKKSKHSFFSLSYKNTVQFDHQLSVKWIFQNKHSYRWSHYHKKLFFWFVEHRLCNNDFLAILTSISLLRNSELYYKGLGVNKLGAVVKASYFKL